MPIYEYRCDACDTVFEEWHRHADDITEQPCPECRKTAHRLISNTSFVLKGGGWYVTEYGGRKADTPANASTETVAPNAKAETGGKTENSPPPPAPAAAPKPATSAAAD